MLHPPGDFVLLDVVGSSGACLTIKTYFSYEGSGIRVIYEFAHTCFVKGEGFKLIQFFGGDGEGFKV